jgi:hypothetical protein
MAVFDPFQSCLTAQCDFLIKHLLLCLLAYLSPIRLINLNYIKLGTDEILMHAFNYLCLVHLWSLISSRKCPS